MPIPEDVESRINNQVRFWIENVNRHPAWIAVGEKAWKNLVSGFSKHLIYTLFDDKVIDSNTLFLNICGVQIRVQKEEEVDENDIVCIP